MFHKKYRIYATKKNSDIQEMTRDILSQTAHNETILKLVFFHAPADNREYSVCKAILMQTVNDFFEHQRPLVSYIAQEPHDCSLLAEATYLIDTDVKIERGNDYLLLSKGYARELLTDGIGAGNIDAPTSVQTTEIFEKILQILDTAKFSINDIYRQWNYIEGITNINSGRQNYQEFNDVRSSFYHNAEWNNGYPAATGIGTQKGGVVIEVAACNAHVQPNIAIDNPMQISAHNYSQQVLAGNREIKTTPKFERARMLCNKVYISGTAAIKGEYSVESTDTTSQAMLTMQIIDHLVSFDNIPFATSNSIYEILRIYVKHYEDIPAVQKFMDVHYPAVQKLYVTADICREELLIEIEGIAKQCVE